ncbi:hypothetical protein SPSIL_055640 [Sporomusa silvacetica DSM 10669]|uniref:Uncharacterized protein n=1 Tax=Sporomusa silvacetica DSM 10669 TaxID=1123289 RepID=A0ABZ3IUJ4_9FIRM|nr:hypothetical protein SPSIL_36440 [Sporomusa silvacetica DSM 10669]
MPDVSCFDLECKFCEASQCITSDRFCIADKNRFLRSTNIRKLKL